MSKTRKWETSNETKRLVLERASGLCEGLFLELKK